MILSKTYLLIALLCFQCITWAQNTQKQIKISDDISLIQLSPNAYVHVSLATFPTFGKVASNGLVFIDQGKAFLFDTPVTVEQTEALIKWFEKNLHVTFTGFIPNHWHEDCMGGLACIKKRHIPSYANQMTIDQARSHQLPLPDHGFKDSLKLKMNNKSIDCYYFGGGHTTDNITVWIPSEKILFGGCLIRESKATSKGNLSDADVKAWPATIKKIMAEFPSAQIVIPGHGAIGGYELLTHTLDVVSK